MKTLLSLSTILLFVMLISCGKTDVTSEANEPVELDLEQMVGFIGQPYSDIKSNFTNTEVVISDSLGVKKASFSVLDRESPNPNFICELTEKNGVITNVLIKSSLGSYGTLKNTFYYFDRLLSEKYTLSKFYAIDADGGVNRNNNSKQDLYTYLNYNTSSGAALEFKAPAATILNSCLNESDKAFTISIEKNNYCRHKPLTLSQKQWKEGIVMIPTINMWHLRCHARFIVPIMNHQNCGSLS
ncbi:hypothetical protein [Niabella ginsengisoli]|uniref:Lipoprotein n=1 Tax=Niabella ginsengisoli TaxID=522298 RepID=A0ABS9SFE0_9BACT|nr:hypothetical protein [Niabella ginsengisoli]MCH5597076.1 hypothetical protein [Niabella ginsengisoli]